MAETELFAKQIEKLEEEKLFEDFVNSHYGNGGISKFSALGRNKNSIHI